MSRRSPTDVAALLPTQVAQMLSKEDAIIQRGVVVALGEMIEAWEDGGLRLAPHEFEVVVESIVVYMIVMSQALHRITVENVLLKRGTT